MSWPPPVGPISTQATSQANGLVFGGKVICTYINGGKIEPTRARFVPVVDIVKKGECGITLEEAKAIVFLSEIAASQGEFVSSMVVESFGGGEAGFLVAGHFSVGDNKTLATIVKTFVENLLSRAFTHVTYEAFKRKRPSPTAATQLSVAQEIDRELASLKKQLFPK